MPFLAITSALALAATSPVSAHPLRGVDTITVGHKSLRGQTPRLGVDTTEIFMERDGKRQMISTGIESVSKTAEGILVVFYGQSRNGVSIDSVTISPTTLAPIRHVEAFTGQQATYAFNGGKLTGTSKDSTGEHAIDKTIDAGRFDFSVVQQVTNALPLTAGYEATILAYDVAQHKERSVGYTVVSQDHLTWHGGDVAAWKTVMDLGTHQVTRWIDARTRRDLQLEINAPNTT